MSGRFFKNYFLADELGEGGMSKVVLAFDIKRLRFVALKFLHQNVQKNQALLARMRREVAIYRTLEHKNVVGLVEDALDQSPPYMALEFLRGTSLEEFLQNHPGPLPPADAFQIFSDLTEALHITHRQGVVHRDIQPANVVLTYMGWAKVLDYGIAYREDDLLRTNPGTIMGTLVYGSPEQNMGIQVDPRSDMYSLGLLLYEMLTGRRALAGENLAQIRGSQAKDLPSPRLLVPSIPVELDDICQNLTTRMAEDRFENATKLLIELGKLRVGNNSFESRLFSSPRARRRQALRKGVFEEKWAFVENMAARIQSKGEAEAEVFFFRAKALHALGRWEEAVAEFHGALSRAPHQLQWWVDYVVARIQQGEPDRAREVLKDCPQEGPEIDRKLIRALENLLDRRQEWPEQVASSAGGNSKGLISRLMPGWLGS